MGSGGRGCAGGFPQGFLCLALSCACCPEPGLEPARSNLSGKWLFLEFHRREERRSLEQDARRELVPCLEKHGLGRGTDPPCRCEPWRGAAVQGEQTGGADAGYIQGKSLCLGRPELPPRGEGRVRELQTDPCLCKPSRGRGNKFGGSLGSIPAAPWCGVSANTGDVRADAGYVRADTSDVHAGTSDVCANAGGVCADAGDVHADASDARTDTSDVHAGTGDVSADASDVCANACGVCADAGDARADTSDVRGNTGHVHADTGDVSADTGDARENTGHVCADTGDVSADAGDVRADTSDVHANTGGVRDSCCPTGTMRVGSGQKLTHMLLLLHFVIYF